MTVRVSRATSVIVHQVPPQAAERFLSLQEGLAKAVEPFPGYQATEIYPPNDPSGTEWVVVIHFADSASLKTWIDSPIRAECIEKVPREIGSFRQETLATGFGAWFTGSKGGQPPGWKMVMTVLLGLYPTVILLSMTVGQITGSLGTALSVLIANAMSVSILQYVVMPVLNRVSSLASGEPSERPTSVTHGRGVILLLLSGLAFIFAQCIG